MIALSRLFYQISMLSLVLFMARKILALRYSVEFQHFEIFDTEDPVIVFPNHPALVDPMILISHIAQKKLLAPIMTETYIHTPGLGGIIRALGTVPV